MELICFTFIMDSHEVLIQVEARQYTSLMTLILDKVNLVGFGLCCGMGSCGTCEIILNGSVVLACEIPVDTFLSGARVVMHRE